MSVRGIPVQELPENQDPDVAYNLIEMTGEKIPLEVAPADAPKKRGRKPKAEETPAEEPAPEEPAED